MVSHFGFIHPVKGLETLLLAWPAVLRNYPRARLLLIGNEQSLSLHGEEAESYVANLRRLTVRLGIESSVTFTGYQPDSVASRLLSWSDLLVLPFNHGVTLKSGSLIAGLAHALPIIATWPEEPTDQLRHGENVFHVPPRDPAALAEAMLLVLADSRLRLRLRQGAASLGAAFSWPTIARRHLDVYEGLFSGKTGLGNPVH